MSVCVDDLLVCRFVWNWDTTETQFIAKCLLLKLLLSILLALYL